MQPAPRARSALLGGFPRGWASQGGGAPAADAAGCSHLSLVTPCCLTQTALGGGGRWKTLHLGLLGLSSRLCGGFSIGGGPGELWGLLRHPDISLFLLSPSHFFLVLCTSHLFKLEGFKLFFLPCNVPREFLPGFSESLLVGITLLVLPPVMSWGIGTERGAQEERGVGKAIQKEDARSPPFLPRHSNWVARGPAVATDSFVAFQAMSWFEVEQDQFSLW